jgi:phycocyanin-associated rod linker protein
MTSLMAALKLGIAAEDQKVELRSKSQEELDVVIDACYRQVFGNAYLMSSERVSVAESMFRNGDISVKEFIRTLAKSEIYRQKFFYPNSQNRFIELNFKHLLGRAPADLSEINAHTNCYLESGYDAEIDSYIDSAEYEANFGDNIVPYYTGFSTQNGQKMVVFPRLFELYRGRSNSDKAQGSGGKARLGRQVAQNSASPIYIGGTGDSIGGTTNGERGQLYRLRVIQGAKAGGGTRVRVSSAEYIVSYEQLSWKLQQINKQGGKVTQIVPA